MSGPLPRVRGRHARRSRPIRRASAGLSPARAGALLGMLLAGAAIYGVSGSTAFGYERLEIDDMTYTAPSDVRAALDLVPGENLFQVRTERLAERVRTLPTVFDARVEVSLPDTLIVRVVERSPIIVWQVDDGRYLVDDTGTLFVSADAPGVSGASRLPVVHDERPASARSARPGWALDPVEFEAARRLASIAPDDIDSSAPRLSVTVSDANGFVLATDPPSWDAIFGFYTPILRQPELIPAQVRILRSLLSGREAEVGRVFLPDDQGGTYVPRETPAP